MSALIPVLVNRSGGAAAAKGDVVRAELETAFADAGMAIDLRLLDGDEIAPAVARFADAPLVVVGGGDGTLGGAAAAILGRAATLGILPLGTRNHLARDLGIPLDLPGAAQVIANGDRRRIDVARVNARVFVNNASIGLYPELVRLRETGQGRLHLPKWLASVPAAWAVLRRLRHHRLHLSTVGIERDIVSPILFVGNNRYTLEAGQVGTRSTLDDGRLSVLAVARRGRRALIGMALRAAIGRADPAEDFAIVGDVTALSVSSRSSRIEIALDGEVIELATPLDFEIDRGALSVCVPELST